MNTDTLGSALARCAFTFDDYDMAYPEITNVVIATPIHTTSGREEDQLVYYNYFNLTVIPSRKRVKIRSILEHFKE
jgi:hypothetical protein